MVNRINNKKITKKITKKSRKSRKSRKTQKGGTFDKEMCCNPENLDKISGRDIKKFCKNELTADEKTRLGDIKKELRLIKTEEEWKETAGGLALASFKQLLTEGPVSCKNKISPNIINNNMNANMNANANAQANQTAANNQTANNQTAANQTANNQTAANNQEGGKRQALYKMFGGGKKYSLRWRYVSHGTTFGGYNRKSLERLATKWGIQNAKSYKRRDLLQKTMHFIMFARHGDVKSRKNLNIAAKMIGINPRKYKKKQDLYRAIYNRTNKMSYNLKGGKKVAKKVTKKVTKKVVKKVTKNTRKTRKTRKN